MLSVLLLLDELELWYMDFLMMLGELISCYIKLEESMHMMARKEKRVGISWLHIWKMGVNFWIYYLVSGFTSIHFYCCFLFLCPPLIQPQTLIGAVLVRSLKSLPRSRCWFAGYSEADAVEIATEFNENWDRNLCVGLHDCRHYTNGNNSLNYTLCYISYL